MCCRPRKFENLTKDCYDEDVRKSLAEKGWSKCRDWYYMVGVYKGFCNELNCIERIRCCRMTPPGTYSQIIQNTAAKLSDEGLCRDKET